jgi:effector-binding domain-containing protein
MKRVFAVIVIAIFVFLIASFFIPASVENRVFIANTYQNIASSLNQPRNWTKWDAGVREAWQKDSSTCSFHRDSARNIFTIEIPGKKIRVTQLSYLLYQLEEVKNNGTSSISGIALTPYAGYGQRHADDDQQHAGNDQQRSEHNPNIVYSQATNLFYKLFPFLEKAPFAKRTVSDLRSYLENSTRFYGFSIDVKQTADTFFLTKKEDLPQQDLFSRMPVLFREIDQYARENGCRPGIKNITYSVLAHDSLTLMAGYNIDKMIKGDYLYNFRQLPGDQVVAVGTFNGSYHDRPLLYQAMEKYISDHQLIRIGLPYERYLSALPVADTSAVNLELCYPLRAR